MRKLIILMILLATPALAQTTTNPSAFTTINVSAKVIGLSGSGQTDAATDLQGTINTSVNSWMMVDSILDSSSGAQAYLGGFSYSLPSAWTPALGTNFRLFLTGSVGIDRIVPSTGPVAQHIAFAAGVGFLYRPSSTGVFGLGALGRWVRLPGAPGGPNFAEVALGPNLTF